MIPYSFSAVRGMIDLRDSIGMVRDSSCFINGFENGGLRWPRHRNDAVQLSHRQIKLLLEGISPLLSGSNPHQMGIYIDFSLLIF